MKGLPPSRLTFQWDFEISFEQTDDFRYEAWKGDRMRLSLRFVLPLLLVLAAIAYGVAPLVDKLTLSWFVRDLDARSTLIANTLEEPLQEQLALGNKGKAADFFNRISQDERLYAVGYCASPSAAVLTGRSLPAPVRCDDLDRWQANGDHLLPSPQGPLHVAVKAMASVADPLGRLVVVHDMSFVTRRSEETKRYLFYAFMALAAVVSLVTVVVAQLSWRGWMAGMRSMLRGAGRRPTRSRTGITSAPWVSTACARRSTSPSTGSSGTSTAQRSSSRARLI